MLDAAIEHVADNGPPESVWDWIAPTIEENNVHDGNDDVLVIWNADNSDDENVKDPDSELSLTHSMQDNESRHNRLSMLFAREAWKDIMSNSEYHKNMHTLSDSQCSVIMFNCTWYKWYIKNLWSGLPTDGLRLHLGVPGGTGQSHVI